MRSFISNEFTRGFWAALGRGADSAAAYVAGKAAYAAAAHTRNDGPGLVGGLMFCLAGGYNEPGPRPVRAADGSWRNGVVHNDRDRSSSSKGRGPSYHASWGGGSAPRAPEPPREPTSFWGRLRPSLPRARGQQLRQPEGPRSCAGGAAARQRPLMGPRGLARPNPPTPGARAVHRTPPASPAGGVPVSARGIAVDLSTGDSG